MNRHQVLTGACNNGDQCYAVGSVEGIHFTAYATGCDIVILASDFQRVQIIPGVTHGNIKVSCIDCSTDTGKIAASYLSQVYIFEPTPLLHHESSHKLDYHWYQTAKFEAECVINCLCWNLEGSRLLTAGEIMQAWQLVEALDEEQEDRLSQNVKFQLGVHEDESPDHIASSLPHINVHDPDYILLSSWHAVWRCKPSSAVYHLKYSFDGLLFASAGKNDRLVKIWYEDRKIQLPLSHADSSISPRREDLNYSFVYIAHPRAVTGFSWRKTSKYMPRGSVANMLVTACKDNVCRIWCETILPDDGCIDLEQFHPNSSFHPKFHTQRHKKRFMQRLRTIRHAIHKRKKQLKFGPETVMTMANNPSSHDFHKFAFQQNGVAPALHFHLAASVNPETDIPLQPVVGAREEHQFQLHWLNNKELQFTMESEKILQEIHKDSLHHVDSQQKDQPNGDIDHQPNNCNHIETENDHYQPEEDLDEGSQKKKKKSRFFRKKSKHKKQKDGHILGSHEDSQSSIGSDASSDYTMSFSDGMTPTSSPEVAGSLVDALDRKIEILLRDWHQNPDMLFSIHPVDGSFMVWHVDWLDEYTPYSYRQAQISFSSRLPHAIPIPDARTMASNLLMYCNYSKMDIKSVMKLSESKSFVDAKFAPSSAATGKCSAGQNDNMLIPNVLMISKHANGSLNQWQTSFTENSKFTTVVSVAHASRACGHRFRTNTAACHPVLPLLLTTSHHNIPEEDLSQKDGEKPKNGLRNSWLENKENEKWSPDKMGIQFCSELILWRVDPVGPLSKSGGIVELARINSPNISAFSNVAWVPTLLPSTSFGTFSNSPSALFVASDGTQLRLYQAVIDARTLLMETSVKKEHQMSFSSNTSSGYSAEQHQNPGDLFNIVSLQSSSRPGCIIELEALTDAEHDWQQSQLLHVFQEQLMIEKSSKGDKSAMEPVVDLRNLSSFEEHFYLVVLEKASFGGSILHMWKITVSSSADSSTTDFMQDKNYVMDYTLVEADDTSSTSSRACSPDLFVGRPAVTPTLSYSSIKVSTQFLPLPKGVEVISANVAAGHLSSASIYPACLAPYLLVTACSDGEVRFWQCNVTSPFSSSPINIDLSNGPSSLSATKVIHEFGIENYGGIKRPSRVSHSSLVIPEATFTWKEWKMMYQEEESSAIHVPGKPITVSCAYTGRVAIAYRFGGIKTVSNQPENKFFNLCVAIYECESTGGSEWVREDTIELKNIKMPDPKAEIDLDVIYGSSESVIKNPEYPTSESPKSLTPSQSLVNVVNMNRTKSVPSISTIYSVRRSISEPHGHLEGVLQQKHLVQLDWVSTEDGSHVLTVGVGPKIMMYGQVSNEIVEASQKAGAEQNGNTKMTDPGRKVMLNESNRRRTILQATKSMLIDDYQEQLQWMKLRSFELTTADGLPPLPMHISWVRGGILVVAMDNEMHVYSQWQSGSSHDPTVTGDKEMDIRDFGSMSFSLGKPGLLPSIMSTPSFKPSFSVPNFKRVATSLMKRETQKTVTKMTNGTLERSESDLSLSVIHELGLFEASRQANPVLPQYHPKSLMELLNFGKVRRVKAILAHLVRCIAGGDVTRAAYTEDKDWEDSKHHIRQRAMSISALSSGEPVQIEEEENLDYIEISSIPPLPLYALLAADDDHTQIKSDALECGAPNGDEDQTDYNELFQTSFEDEELDTNVLSTSAENMPSKAKSSTGNVLPSSNPNYFGSDQAHLLSKHLTHVQLPGLSSLDQMYLLALADTVAHIKMDFADRFRESSSQTVERQISYHPTESLDDCGLRFLLAIRHHNYLMRILPPTQRVLLKKQGLKTFNIVWAFHSEATEELVSAIPSVQKGDPTWEELREFGTGWFISNINVLKKTIEKVAKSAFQAKKDPMDSCIFYMALKKKNILWGLFRSVEDKKMADFFRNDFSEDRWRKAALKNAFALLGRQRFMHAAGFFLLGGSLEDAVEVCIDKLEDIQLALVICRLYDGEDIMAPSVQRILNMHILGRNPEGGDTDPNKAHPDPFLRSMALWLLKDYKGALRTLLLDKKSMGGKLKDQMEFDSLVKTSVFNFYNYLRTHPLLVRQRLAKAAPSMRRKSVIPGFTQQQSIMAEVEDEAFSCVDKITPMERRLFFSTAHAHYKNGCPILALEVLSKLPYVEMKEMPHFEAKILEPMHEENEGCISTGILGDFSDSSQRADYVDWSQPVTGTRLETASSFDWSSPKSNVYSRANDIDWGTPVKKFDDEELKLDFSIGTSDAESEDDDLDVRESCSIPFAREGVPSIMIRNASEDTLIQSDVPDEFKELKHKLEQFKLEQEMKKKVTQQDIFAQQYKFIACLKILMEEMQTLATGFEVDGGQLRFQLYIWLEKEMEAMRSLCGYGDEDEQDDIKTVISDVPTESIVEIDESLTYLDSPRSLHRSMSTRSDSSLNKPSLHEVILADKMDFEAKLERTSRRKLWLKQHQQMLRTLIAYCMLQGAGGGGLASVQMELLLLLQELQQERPHQQLLSPLPFPTTLPLLSACIASSKTVTADPIRHIQCLTQDLLHTIIEFTSPPGLYGAVNVMLVMRNLSIALSSCVYQCLCDSDSFVVSLNENQDVGLEGFTSHNFAIHASHLMAGVRRHRRRSISGSDDVINTSPAKWPGVTSLRVLIARGKDEDAPKLNIMLCETLIAVYISLLINALSTYDCHLLYRLIAHKFDSRLWSALFGGGVKTVLRVSQSSVLPSNRSSDELLHKQRMKLHMKVMGTEGKHDIKKTYREKYIPPELSMITFFMTKPFIVTTDSEAFTYDSDESLSEEDEEEEENEEEEKDEKEWRTTDRDKTPSLPSSLLQHNDPNSYSWCLLRYVIVKLVLHNLRGFLPQVGIELAELPICSPLMHATLRTIEQWEEVLQGKLELFAGPPDHFIPGMEHDIVPGIPSTKYKAILVPSNNPFINCHATLPIKRLWFHLVKHEELKDCFLRYIFRKRKMEQDDLQTEDSNVDGTEMQRQKLPMKIIHKEQDIITSFALNQATTNILCLATQKEIVELDITNILNPPSWLDDENEMDIEMIKSPTPANAGENVDFLVLQTPSDSNTMDSKGSDSPRAGPSSMATIPSMYPPWAQMMAQSGVGANILLRRPLAGVKRIAAHPQLPHYLTGSTDGSVRLWEWGHNQPLTVLRQPGSFSKVTKVLFSSQGNKCCVSDAEGQICLWQVGMGSNFNKPILSLSCHNKTTSDFVFVGSSSLIGTAGHSSESRNVCLWDTLLPARSALVHAFICHEHGSPAVAYASHHQLLISGGRNGEICLFDVRQRQLRHTFQAHESPIRCLAIDQEEEYFVTGSAEGDIKIWGLDVHQLISSLPGEHSKSGSFFRGVGTTSGVSQVAVGPGHHLFSCGVDGSMKFRVLPERDSVVRYWQS
ncbi:hypothetical protein ACJMK2_044544 [Sinanodonta woodiana]|uniref:RAVE complex protein Rav1 C-terminal domain-containing protein n=1 Tax=Sinanodonta woodiana TaxID=1069815 RepID=A0ABD3W274_SINWO